MSLTPELERLDRFVANDGTPSHLWINLGGARFAESALMAGVKIDQDGAPKPACASTRPIWTSVATTISW